jgi:hypothetical protein
MQRLDTTSNELLASALRLASRGIGVIPLWWPQGAMCACPKAAECSSPAKHPLTYNGLNDATTDAATIANWWERYPQANIGLVTGGQIDVIDVDGAIPAYQQLIADIGSPQHVATVITGRGDGGLHIYCTPGGNKTIPSGKHGLPNKIEVKGAGGYVVAPPSKHVSGGTYTYMTQDTGEIHGDIVLTQWLAKIAPEEAKVIELRPTPPTPMMSLPTHTNTDNVTKYRDAVINSACDAVAYAGEGSRWMALATEAVPKICRGIAGGLIPRDVGTYALEGAARQAGLDAAEVARIPELIDLMLAQGIKEPITPPQDTNALTDAWLAQLPKDDAGDLPEAYTEAINQRTSWWPIDLGPVLRNEITEHAPEFLTFTDGQPLFYAGKVNGIIGESESGKTWIALEAVKQALASNKHVLYMDFEDSAPGIVSRLRSLGVTDFTGLSYMSPDEGFGTLAKLDLAETLHTLNPDVAVLDGFNAAMNVLGLDINSNNDATTFAQLLLKPVAATGVCLIYVDHVPKSKDARGKGGIGAQAKRAMTTGCTVAVHVLEPFGRGNTGRLALSVDKDRAGHVRGYATDAKNLGTVVLASDKDSGNIEVDFHAFDAQGIAGKRAVKIVDLVAEALGELGTPVYIGEIEKHIKEKGETLSAGAVSAALRTLGSMVCEIKKTEKSKNGKWCLNEMDAFSELSDDGDDDDN